MDTIQKLSPLRDILLDTYPILEYGVHVASSTMSAHNRLKLELILKGCQDIINYRWGGRGIMTAYQNAAHLTIYLEKGLSHPKHAARLRDKGYIDPLKVWKTVFESFGMTYTHKDGHPIFPPKTHPQ
jgi:hypothetical protein